MVKGLKKITYLFLFLFVLAAFLVQGIDTLMLKGQVEAEFAEQTGLKLNVGSLKISPFLSLKMQNISVDDGRGLLLRFDNLTARALFLPLFIAKPSVRLIAVSDNGFLRFDIGSNLLKGGEREFSIKSFNFPISDAISKVGGRPVMFDAELNGGGMVSVLDKSIDASGEIALTLENFRYEKGFLEGIIMGSLRPQSVSCRITVGKRMLVAKECFANAAGGSFELRVASRLADNRANTPLSGSVLFKPETLMLKGLLSMYGRYRKPDGAYHLPLKGTLSRPGFAL